MANITVRREEAPRIAPSLAELEPLRWTSPFRTMRNLLNWDPFRTMGPSFPILEEPASFLPAFEVKETKDSYVFKADVPGVKESDLEITLTDNRMNIGGKRESEKEETTDTYYACERSYGSFARSFTLPEGADAEHTRAELRDGVLTIVVAKQPKSQPKKILIGNPEKHRA
jgi:HSP20 family protein